MGENGSRSDAGLRRPRASARFRPELPTAVGALLVCELVRLARSGRGTVLCATR
jgi:hypothetical protein